MIWICDANLNNNNKPVKTFSMIFLFYNWSKNIYLIFDYLLILCSAVQDDRWIRKEERNAQADQGESKSQKPLGCKCEIDWNTSVWTRKRTVDPEFRKITWSSTRGRLGMLEESGNILPQFFFLFSFVSLLAYHPWTLNCRSGCLSLIAGRWLSMAWNTCEHLPISATMALSRTHWRKLAWLPVVAMIMVNCILQTQATVLDPKGYTCNK